MRARIPIRSLETSLQLLILAMFELRFVWLIHKTYDRLGFSSGQQGERNLSATYYAVLDTSSRLSELLWRFNAPRPLFVFVFFVSIPLMITETIGLLPSTSPIWTVFRFILLVTIVAIMVIMIVPSYHIPWA